MDEDRSAFGRLIERCLEHYALVLLSAALLAASGIVALRSLPVDALPDLSDVQVIVRTSFPGQAPSIVEDQVTFPLASALKSVPGARSVRAYSSTGESLVYVIFKDGTDRYWARSRVAEQLAQAAVSLPEGALAALGPDATGVGWIYEYALVDRSGKLDLAQLRALQDWQIKTALQSIDGVAEVATVGGMVREFQVLPDPQRLLAYGLSIRDLRDAIRASNGEAGGGVIEMAGAEYMVRATGYLKTLEDLRQVSLQAGPGAVPLTLGEIAQVRYGPELRRGLADLDGAGETVGGLIVMRSGANPASVIEAVRQRLASMSNQLPAGVEVVGVYDQSRLISRTLHNLTWRLVEEFLIVALVCAIFLWHLRSSLVLIVVLPLVLLAVFLALRLQGISANLMSLGGLAIAIGAAVDAAIVMIENLHKKLEASDRNAADRRAITLAACIEVAPALFASLLVAALSFIPVLLLQGQEGRLFAPLVYTKTYTLLAAALLSVTLVPILIWLFVRGRTHAESDNPLNRLLTAGYRPLLAWVLEHPRVTIVIAALLVALTVLPLSRLGTEVLPDMDEGDLLYMPALPPAISAATASDILLKMDRAIAAVPEVEHVFGKAGHGETATDPAPLDMFETLVQLKSRDQWRSGLTPAGLRAEIESKVQLPGVSGFWTYPVKGRIDMLATGVRTPLGIKIKGADPDKVTSVAIAVQEVLKRVPGAGVAYAERNAGGRYLDIRVNRAAAARAGVSIAEIHEVIESAIGGRRIGESLQGRGRFPIMLQYPASWRDSPERLRQLPFVSARGAQVLLGDVAEVSIDAGPSMIRSEDGVPTALVYVDAPGSDLEGLIERVKAAVSSSGVVPGGYTLEWSGQHEYYQRALARLRIAVPLVGLLILIVLMAHFRRLADVSLVLLPLPVALCGGVWLMWALGYQLSVAVVVGFLALAGLAAETAVVMLVFLNQAWGARRTRGATPDLRALHEAVIEGALVRLRPKLMTVSAIVLSLLPILIGEGSGSEIMKRIAAPMVGGMLSSAAVILLVVPALYVLIHRRDLVQR